ncbi:sporulation protein [Streptomyces chryseus]|uniref:Sporulation protein n=1 Tax=Streptomyces chryseus TaxID=68186 RepID=A0ABQ3DHR4_9ACTN|nr:sporulation protein [Streptomyces chryseus]GHA85554.1 hypothetical protein GCM10010346_05190 [Streptomyces chryseus]
MAFRKFLSSLGINAPSVETVVENPAVRPGEQLHCTVTVRGGGADVEVERLRLELVVRAEDREADGSTAWANPYTVVEAGLGAFVLPAGGTVTHRIALDVPWEMPLTHARGGRIKGGRAAVRTELSIDNSVDKGDFDEIEVHALPAQDTLHQALADLGFRLHEAEVKVGAWPARLQDRRVAPYWQETDFFFPESAGRGRFELEAVFVARQDAVDLHPGGYPPATFAYADMDLAKWTAALDAHIRSYWAG